jgi:hypothetical protein
VFLVVHELVLINTDSNMHGDKIKKKTVTFSKKIFVRVVSDPIMYNELAR